MRFRFHLVLLLQQSVAMGGISNAAQRHPQEKRTGHLHSSDNAGTPTSNEHSMRKTDRLLKQNCVRRPTPWIKRSLRCKRALGVSHIVLARHHSPLGILPHGSNDAADFCIQLQRQSVWCLHRCKAVHTRARLNAVLGAHTALYVYASVLADTQLLTLQHRKLGAGTVS